MHNPANPNLKLKHFSSTNVGSSSLSSRRITLAEGDHAVDINESFRELEHMADFKAALRVDMKAMTIVLPFNHSISAIESFMDSSVYCTEKTVHLSDCPYLILLALNSSFPLILCFGRQFLKKLFVY
jgi:hypothetical protein